LEDVMPQGLAITTSNQPDERVLERAQRLAARWHLPLVQRARKSPLAPLFEQADALLVVETNRIVLRAREVELPYSLGMARLRKKRFAAGERDDLLLRHSELRAGDAVLDCTLGLAGDALVAARAVGSSGRVVGLE
jgi:hypothetical protein